MSGAVKRMIARRGEAWTIQNWTVGAEDEYKDRARTPASGATITVIRTETAKEGVTIDFRGEKRTIDVQLIVRDDVDVSEIDDSTKAAPLVTSPEGTLYDAIALGREGQIIGFRRIFLSQRRSKP